MRYSGVLRIVVGVLVALGGCSGASTPKPASDGPRLFAAVCAKCHGADGHGGPAPDGGVGPRNFHDGAFQRARTDGELKKVIVEGKSGRMPAFGATFTDAQLGELIGVIRSFDPDAKGAQGK